MKKTTLYCLLITALFACQFSMGQFNLNSFFPTNTATHTAAQSGNWNDTATWGTAGIPDTGAIVHIPQGITVTYDHFSNTHIFAIRVDGTFICQELNQSQTTQIVFDTFVSGMMSDVKFLAQNSTDGKINVNITAFDLSNPPASWNANALAHFTDNKTVKQMTVTASGDDRYNSYAEAMSSSDPLTITRVQNGTYPNGKGVLGRYDWDPTQVSLGLMTMGNLHIEGREKTNMVKLAADAMTGTNTINLTIPPTGWNINDELIITSGGNLGATNNGEDKVTISNISGNAITLSSNLTKNHEGKPSENLHCYVGNLTRNITFKSPNNVPIDERAHMMAMNGTKDIFIKNATFRRMGRTDKSKLTDDFYFDTWLAPKVFTSKVSTLGQECAKMAATPKDELSNPRGRYSIHLHKLGAQFGAKMAQVTGNVVWDNPGWGITHHDSHANVSNNVVYDVTGAGIVTETGSETGLWENNLMVKIQSGHNGDVYESSLYYDDYLFSGVGLGMKGRAVLCKNNVVANATFGLRVINFNNSITNLDRLDAQALATTRMGYEVDNFPLSTNGYSIEGDGVMPLEAALIMENTTVINCNQGMKSIERDMGVNHESRSIFKGFKAWGVNIGLAIVYQADYSYEDVYISGKNGNAIGIDLWKHSHNHTFNKIKLEDLAYGMKVSKVVLSNNASVNPKQRNNGFTPWIFLDLSTNNVGQLYKMELDNASAEPTYPYTECTDNTLIMNASDFTARETTFTSLNPSALRVDYNEANPDELLKFTIDGVITDDLGSYDMGIQQAWAQGDLRLGYPERIYQFASKAKFEEYLTNNGVYQNTATNELYFIINEALPNRLTYEYTTFPVRIVIDNPPSTGIFASPQIEGATNLVPKNQLISRLATISQSSTQTGLSYDDGYSGTAVGAYGAVTINATAQKAIDGNNNGKINAQYYQRGLVPVGSFSQTTTEHEPWIELDFGEQKTITHFDIWNTVELNGGNLETNSTGFNNFYVFISDTPFTSAPSTATADLISYADYSYLHSGGNVRKVSQDHINVKGRYLRIQSNESTNTRLKIAEIEVIGKKYVDESLSNNSIQDTAIRLYPNPTNDEIHIDLGKPYTEVEITITNSLGQRISTQSFSSLKETTLNLSNNATGIYFIDIKSRIHNIAKVFKVIKHD